MSLRAALRTASSFCAAFVSLTLAGAAGAQVIQINCTPSEAACSNATTSLLCASNATFTSQCPALCDAAVVAAATCGSETWFQSLCGQREMARLEALGNGGRAVSKCRNTVQNRAMPRAVRTPRLMPSSRFQDTYAVAPAIADNAACELGAANCNVVHTKNPRPVSNSTPMTGDFTGKMVGKATQLGTGLVGGQTQLENLHAAWRNDGAASSSCDEYVFHVFEGYSLFEDATLALENDPRAVFNVAYTPLAWGDTRYNRAIGALGAIYDWAGNALRQANLFPMSSQPKNDFTAFHFEPVDTYVTIIAAQGLFGQPQVVTRRQPASVYYFPTLIDANLRQKVQALQDSQNGVHDETFAWHAQASATMAAAGYSDELLERLVELRSTFQDLMRQRAEVLSLRKQCPAPEALVEEGPPDAQSLLDPIWNPELGLAASPSILADVAFAQLNGQLLGGQFFFAAGGGGACLPLLDEALQRQLSAIDDKLEAVLHEADAQGCLEAGPTPCDWAPSDFQHRVRGLFAAQRQAVYDECLANTTTGFVQTLRNPPAGRFAINGVDVSYDGWSCPSGLGHDYTAAPDWVKFFFDCDRAFKSEGEALLIKSLSGKGSVTHDAYGNKVMKQTTGDSFNGGNALFGATVSYSAGWDLTQLHRQNLCQASAGVSATASITAKVLGASTNLLNVGAALRANGNSTLSVRAAGVEIAPLNQYTGVNFNPITGTPSRSQEFLSASQIFMIGPFPIRVRAAAAGNAGLDYRLEQTCDAGAMSLNGTFRPFAGITAQASAGVSAVIAEAGIKIDLVLAELSLPLYAALSAATGSNVLRFDTQLDLAARFLDGRAALYAEVCYLIGCDSWEYELFSWLGLRSNAQLFNSEFDVPLAAIAPL
jgi:hypothetical protein